MLLDDEKALTVDCLDASIAPFGPTPSVPAPQVPEPTVSGYTPSPSRYGEKRGINASALTIAIGIHVVLGLALLTIGVHATKSERTRLVTMDLSAPPPPPPPPQPPTQKTVAQKLSVTMQQPMEQVPVIPQPPIALAPAKVDLPPATPVVDIAPPTPAAAPAAPAAAEVVNSSSLGTRRLSGAPPRFPIESRKLKQQGTVRLLLVLGLNGAVESITVSQSSGHPQLDQAALSAVRRWRWAPTMVDGAPAKVRGVVEIPFILKGTD